MRCKARLLDSPHRPVMTHNDASMRTEREVDVTQQDDAALGGPSASESPVEAAPRADTAVVTSWRHLEGRWPGREAHLRRTIAGAQRLWPLVADWEHRIRLATDVLPEEMATGDWFPKVEVRADGVTLLVRPAPPRRRRTTLWTVPEADPRRAPEVKGPDMSLLRSLRERAQDAGAHEAALVTDGGVLVEGGFGTLVWWEADVLTSPPAAGRLASVTEERLQQLAAQRGVAWQRAERTPEQLAGHEVWWINALHGITGVDRWYHAGGAVEVATPHRAEAWNDALDAMP